MKNLYIVDVLEMLDTKKIEEYNQEFLAVYPDSWHPFVTNANFNDYLENMKKVRDGQAKTGVKEIFYWFMEDDKIIGSGSIRLNPEIDEITEIYCGHIFYQIILAKRHSGYGTVLCHLLLEKMNEMGYKEAIISCYDTNIGSIKIIETNGGELLEIVNGDGSEDGKDKKTRRYKINIKESLLNYNNKNNQNIK